MDEFVLELDHFADCIRSGQEPEPDGMEGLRDLATIEAIYRSAEEKRTVPIVKAAGGLKPRGAIPQGRSCIR